MTKKIAFLGFAFLIGAWFRIKGILDGSFSFTYDVGRDLLAVKSIIENHDLVLIGATSGLEGLFYGPWWYYFLTIPFVFTDGNPQGIVLAFTFIGAANIVLAFFIGRSLGGNLLGILWASFIAISPSLISSSSQLWNPNIIPTLVLLSVWLIQKIFIVQDVKTWTWIALGIILILVVEMEIVFGVLFFLSIFLSAIVFLRQKIVGSSHFMKNSFFFIFGVFIVELPRIIFEIRHSFLMTKKIINHFFELSTPAQTASIFSKARITEAQMIFEKTWTETIAGGNHLVGALLLVIFVLSCVIYYSKASISEKLILRISLVTSFVFFFGFLFFSQGIWGHYLVGLPILFTLIAGIAVSLVFRNFPFPKTIVIILLSIFLINIWSSRIIESLYLPTWEGDPSVYRNQLAIIDYVYKEADGKRFKYVLYTPPVHDYTYRYLFSWYGEAKYGYIPDDNQRDLFFFIIEPDDLYPHRLIDWLTYRQFDGKIIKEEEIRSGIIVQTRIPEREN